MKMPSESETMKIFEKLGLKNEEDRLKILLQGGISNAISPSTTDKDYYTIQLSTNTRIGLAEGNCNAELEGDSG